MLFQGGTLISDFLLAWCKHEAYEIKGKFVVPKWGAVDGEAVNRKSPIISEEGEAFKDFTRLGENFSEKELLKWVHKYGLLKDDVVNSKEKVSFIKKEAEEFCRLVGLYRLIQEKNYAALQQRVNYKPTVPFLREGEEDETAFVDGHYVGQRKATKKTKGLLTLDAFFYLAFSIEERIKGVRLTFTRVTVGEDAEYEIIPALCVNSPLEMVYTEFFLAVARNDKVKQCQNKRCKGFFFIDQKRADAKYCSDNCRRNAYYHRHKNKV